MQMTQDCSQFRTLYFHKIKKFPCVPEVLSHVRTFYIMDYVLLLN